MARSRRKHGGPRRGTFKKKKLGKGFIANITPHADGLAKWTDKDIAYLLETGQTPDGDSVGGSMTDVSTNTGMLTAEDRNAMAAYLKSLPARAGKASKK